jgi:hypothetical protein
MYSGLMPVKAGDTSRQLFFIYQPSIGPPVDEVTIWLNGGPGCSSLEGFFQENGRVRVLHYQYQMMKPRLHDLSMFRRTHWNLFMENIELNEDEDLRDLARCDSNFEKLICVPMVVSVARRLAQASDK